MNLISTNHSAPSLAPCQPHKAITPLTTEQKTAVSGSSKKPTNIFKNYISSSIGSISEHSESRDKHVYRSFKKL